MITLSPINSRHAARAHWFGKKFLFSMPLTWTRIDDHSAAIVLLDGREQQVNGWPAQFRFSGSEAIPEPTIDFSAIKGAEIVLNGHTIRIHTVQKQTDKITAIAQCDRRLSSVFTEPLTVSTQFRVTRYTSRQAVTNFEGFILYAVTIN